MKCNGDVLICSFDVKKKFLIQVLYLLLDDKYLDVGWSVHDAFLDVRCVCFLLILPPTCTSNRLPPLWVSGVVIFTVSNFIPLLNGNGPTTNRRVCGTYQ